MRNTLMIHAAALSALVMTAGPAFAEGKADRARAAIAEAKGKIDAVNAMGASGEVPRMVADAMAALRSSEDNLKGGHKDESIADALRASQLADTAIGVAQQARDQAAAAQQADASVAAQAQVSAAQDQAAAAQQQADAANARATSAEHSAATAAADAAAARAAATVPPVTTVTTETTKTAATAPVAKKRVVRHTVKHRASTRPATVTEKTTTTVSTNQ